MAAPPSPLLERIALRIARFGPMTLAEYMTLALGDPAHGYYMRGDPFGARGDFVTAPEISQIFGELIGLWCADAWHAMGAPDPFHLVELGPGRGSLMADALRAARVVPGFHAALRLHLVETGPALRARQHAALQAAAASLAEAPRWHDSLATVAHRPLLLVANEFFDALPIRQFVRGAGGAPAAWSERVVALAPDGRSLAFALRPAAVEAAALLPPEAARVPPGGSFEICVPGASLAGEIGARLAADGGAALIVDYGAARPPGEPTLQAVRAHARHEVLAAPGKADLTAHVDFAALARAARAAGAKAWGPVPQGAFLAALGIEARARALGAGASPAQAEAIAAAQVRLCDPARMGTLFKALAFTHPALGAPGGFA